jgi:hypothetical protein
MGCYFDYTSFCKDGVLSPKSASNARDYDSPRSQAKRGDSQDDAKKLTGNDKSVETTIVVAQQKTTEEKDGIKNPAFLKPSPLKH